MPSVLFVCSANRFRSPLAAEIFRQAIAEEEKEKASPWNIGETSAWQIDTAGIWAVPGQPVLPDVLEAGKQLGLDLASHRSAEITAQMLSTSDLILVMQAHHREMLLKPFPHLKEHIYLLSEVVEYSSHDFPDTHGSFREILQVGVMMNERIRRNLHYICVLAIALHNKRVPA